MPKMRGPVTLDGLVTVDATYDPDVRWNGWLCPAMDRDAVDKVFKAFESLPDADANPRRKWMGNVLVVITFDADDNGAATFERLEPDTDGLYALGAFAWVWSADEPTGRDGAMCGGCYAQIPGCTEPDMGDADVMHWEPGTCAACETADVIVFWPATA